MAPLDAKSALDTAVHRANHIDDAQGGGVNAPMRPEVFHIPLHEALRSAREFCGLSLAQAAKVSGIARQHLCAIENGKCSNGNQGVGIVTLRALANTYGLTVSELIRETNLPESIRPGASLTASERAIVKTVLELTRGKK